MSRGVESKDMGGGGATELKTRICAQGTQTGALWKSRMMGWGGRFWREGTLVYLWLILVDVWQETTKLCKAITLQLKINKLKKFGNKNTKSLQETHAAYNTQLRQRMHTDWKCGNEKRYLMQTEMTGEQELQCCTH